LFCNYLVKYSMIWKYFKTSYKYKFQDTKNKIQTSSKHQIPSIQLQTPIIGVWNLFVSCNLFLVISRLKTPIPLFAKRGMTPSTNGVCLFCFSVV